MKAKPTPQINAVSLFFIKQNPKIFVDGQTERESHTKGTQICGNRGRRYTGARRIQEIS